jgi:hypothetical protein
MRLSEAIRLGAMATAQTWVVAFEYVNGEVTKTCALGAALYACGKRDGMELGNLFGGDWLIEYINCPECLHRKSTVVSTIAHLNDFHKWTRERIADWVEAIEQRVVEPEPEAELAAAR